MEKEINTVRIIYFLPAIFILQSCIYTSPLTVNFEQSAIPEAPDFSDAKYWAALPQKADNADHIPVDSLSDNQDSATADVFFIYPTSYFGKKNWNASVDDKRINAKTDDRSLLHQASVFNGSCKIYAPRYRQVSYHAFFSLDNPDADSAFALAYTDIRNAFLYYLAHYNRGRPIVIAGHSQGTVHAQRLLQEFFDGKPLSDQLVAAYLIGMPIAESAFDVLQPCQQSDATGCYVSWRSFLYGFTPKKKINPATATDIVVVNPLTWTNDTSFADPLLNAGGLNRKANAIYPFVSGTQIHDNYLWVTKPDIPGKLFLIMKNYHRADYNLYWMNMRINVAERIYAFENSR